MALEKPIDEALVLGLNDSHDASACLMQGGRVLVAIQEERLQRVKSAAGYPRNAVDACLVHAGVTRDDIDLVALAGIRSVPVNMLGTLATFGIAEHLRLQEEKRYPLLYEGREVPFRDLFPDYRPKCDVHYPLDALPLKDTREMSAEERRAVLRLRLGFIADDLGISETRIHRIDHHQCHAYYAYYASAFRGERVAALTSDGGGDGVYDSVSVFDETGRYTRLHASHDSLIGKFYGAITLLLGMRPQEEEYKVMGMAPYARDHKKHATRELLHSLQWLDGMRFVRHPEMRDFFFYLKDRLKTERFDGIAGGLQDFSEAILCQWVEAVASATDARLFAYAGGVANNVKANMEIAALDCVDGLFVPAGPGDESLSMGAAWALTDGERCEPLGKSVSPMVNAYLGSDFDAPAIDAFAGHPNVRERLQAVAGNAEELAAQALADGGIVAVCRGQMEFGSRALGHRSLLANPGDAATIDRINEAIKGRDFWMPFAPSVLSEYLAEYFVDNDRFDLSFMTGCLASTQAGRARIPAALHPRDRTGRPQSVDAQRAPDYHSLISRFAARTGCGAVLNTSLNIHGKPIVMNPADIAEELLAVDWVELDHFLIGDRFFTRRSA